MAVTTLGYGQGGPQGVHGPVAGFIHVFKVPRTLHIHGYESDSDSSECSALIHHLDELMRPEPVELTDLRHALIE